MKERIGDPLCGIGLGAGPTKGKSFVSRRTNRHSAFSSSQLTSPSSSLRILTWLVRLEYFLCYVPVEICNCQDEKHDENETRMLCSVKLCLQIPEPSETGNLLQHAATSIPFNKFSYLRTLQLDRILFTYCTLHHCYRGIWWDHEYIPYVEANEWYTHHALRNLI